MHFETDVLVVGGGGAGMYAAVAAARNDAGVLLVDRNIVGRGGATIMAQMTVAAALAEEEPDDWELHLADTLEAGRELCNADLATVLCREAPARIREMDAWRVGWAREDGHIKQVMAPGHSRARCCYVDVLNTGPAVAATLRRQISRADGIARLSNVSITDLVVRDGEVLGAVGVDLPTAAPVTIAAKAVVIATGGLTKLYRRNSASANMAGDAFALALRAGAALTDMEFVQFFPIGHLAPRMVGMDPIMWDPFRYKLGGRLLNSEGQEFLENYGVEERGKYVATRDTATYAIYKEVEAGRGSPHGGAFLSFQHVADADLRAAFGPVIDRLAKNGIDLTRMAVEVAPIAHYHMGGVCVDVNMESAVIGLFVAGEAVGGANGANRLSGNAISEALVFGDVAGRAAARHAASAKVPWDARAAAPALEEILSAPGRGHRAGPSAPALRRELQELMWEKVGLFRTAEGLGQALARIRRMRHDVLPDVAVAPHRDFNAELADWFELRAGLLTAEAITTAALARPESRGAHQREDFPAISPDYAQRQMLRLVDGEIASSFTATHDSVEAAQ